MHMNPATPIRVTSDLKENEDANKSSGKLRHGSRVIFKAQSWQSSTSAIRSVIRKLVLALVLLFFLHVVFGLFDSSVDIKASPFMSRRDLQYFSSITTGSRADWTDTVPPFCKRLIANPKPQIKACRRDPLSFSCRDTGETTMFSQFKQDYYLYTQHFAKLKRPGVYLDVAANDPFHYSNTFFMDRCLGWKGVCVEGNPGYHEKLFRERSCQLVPTCVGRTDGEYVLFGLNGGSGGVIGDTFKNAETVARQNKTLPMIRERCTTMKSVLKRNNIVTADYLSLDVEGHEMQVLHGFDWENSKINVISVETSKETLGQITEFLTKAGYKKHHPQMDERSIRSGLIHEDAIFLHKDVVFGSPV